MKICINLPKFMAWQSKHLQHDLEVNKWLLSEKAGRDVGRAAAQKNFLENHVEILAKRWRVEFCRDLCEFRKGCCLGKRLVERDGDA